MKVISIVGSIVKMNTTKIKRYLNNLGVMHTVFLFLIVCITLIINFVLNNIFISKYFSDIENKEVISNTKQSTKIFQSKIKGLETLAEEYGFWDETYNKMQEESIDETWLKENFTEWLPDQYGIDLMIILNRDKKSILQYGLNNINDILNDNKILQSLNEDKYNEETRVSGFKKYGGDIYIISECPIFNNTSEGDLQGNYYFGEESFIRIYSKNKGRVWQRYFYYLR